MGISIFGSWWLLPDYMHLSKLSNGTLEMINYAFLKKREREKVIWEHMEKVMNGDLQESKWEREM